MGFTRESDTNQLYIKLLLLHLGFAVLLYFFRSLSSVLLIGILSYFTFITIQNENRNNEALMAAAYIAGAEVFFRMTGGMIFYETGKYGVIFFLILTLPYLGCFSKELLQNQFLFGLIYSFYYRVF